jgi:hypothetical protein
MSPELTLNKGIHSESNETGEVTVGNPQTEESSEKTTPTLPPIILRRGRSASARPILKEAPSASSSTTVLSTPPPPHLYPPSHKYGIPEDVLSLDEVARQAELAEINKAIAAEQHMEQLVRNPPTADGIVHKYIPRQVLNPFRPNLELYRVAFPKLDLEGTEYLTWRQSLRDYLVLYGLGSDRVTTDKVEAGMIREARKTVILTHLEDELKDYVHGAEYPETILSKLKLRFESMVETQRVQIYHEWMQLGIDSYPSITKYEHALYRLSRLMRTVGHGDLVTEKCQIRKTVQSIQAAHVRTMIQTQAPKTCVEMFHALRVCEADTIAAERRKETMERLTITKEVNSIVAAQGKKRKGGPEAQNNTKQGFVCWACGKEGHPSRLCTTPLAERKPISRAQRKRKAVVNCVQSNVTARGVTEVSEVMSNLSLKELDCRSEHSPSINVAQPSPSMSSPIFPSDSPNVLVTGTPSKKKRV